MENIALIISFIAFPLIIVLMAISYMLYCRYINVKSKIQNKYTTVLTTHDLPIFYSSYFIHKIITQKTFNLKSNKADAIYKLAHISPALALSHIKKNLKSYISDNAILLLYTELNLINNKYATAYDTLNRINVKKLSTQQKAKYLYLQASYELYQTDMQHSADNLSKATKTYRNLNISKFIYEYAQCLYSLAQIYRISNIVDTSFNLFIEARLYFTKLSAHSKIAEINAYLGLLEINRKNYTVAKEYLDSALTITKTHNLKKTSADIYNWLGYIYLLEQDFTNALNTLKTAYKATISQQTKAFSLTLLSQLYFIKKDFKTSLKYANLTLKYNNILHSQNGIVETNYLIAEINYQLNNYNTSKQILNRLIKEHYNCVVPFNMANAYTLLGLVEYKQNNLKKAYNLFKEALDIEHSQNCLKGAAIDYNNLATISNLLGNFSEAKKYLELALNHAKEINDIELENLIKSKQN